MFDPGPRRPVEDPEQNASVLSGLEGGASQRRHTRDGLGSGHDAQEPLCDAQADALGLGDSGEFVLLVASDLDGVLQPRAEGPILGLLVGQSSPQVIDAGFGRGAVDGLDDLLGLAVERLTRLLPIVGQRDDIAVSATENGEGAGDALRDCGHGDAFCRDWWRYHPHDCTRLDGNCPQITTGERPF